jgi:hypothetical protein
MHHATSSGNLSLGRRLHAVVPRESLLGSGVGRRNCAARRVLPAVTPLQRLGSHGHGLLSWAVPPKRAKGHNTKAEDLPDRSACSLLLQFEDPRQPRCVRTAALLEKETVDEPKIRLATGLSPTPRCENRGTLIAAVAHNGVIAPGGARYKERAPNVYRIQSA